MKKLMTIAALGCLASIGAPVPQASQAWVNMRLEQVKTEIMAATSASITEATNGITQAQMVDNAISQGTADMQALFATMTTPSGTQGNTLCYMVAGCSAGLTNSLPYGLMLPQLSVATFGTNDILLTIGAVSNTLAVGSVATLFAPTNSASFSGGGEWAFVVDTYQ